MENEAGIDGSIPLKLSWKNVKYTFRVELFKKWMMSQQINNSYFDKDILKTQSGYVNSGETLFIMGSSGSGKTALLNVLCDRITQSKVDKLEGEVKINDSYTVSQKDFGKYGAYIMKDDVLFPTLSCEEVITFSARLKLNISGVELTNKVDEIIENLGLMK